MQKFISSNISYLLWFVLYFLITWFISGATLIGFFIVLAIYAVSISIALSPIGEAIVRLTESCREPATEQEQNYLMPIFEEVYNNAKTANSTLNSAIKLYIMDAMYVNAFAIGRKTIALTKGAMETFTAEELKGVLAHEFGHMTYGHTKALLLSVIGNFFYSIILWILRLLLSIVESITSTFASMNVVILVFRLMAFVLRIVFEVSTFIFINLGEIILAINSRAQEMQADEFSYKIGYGREQISALYLLQKIEINAKVKLSERLKASHPYLSDRIAHLEKLEDEDLKV